MITDQPVVSTQAELTDLVPRNRVPPAGWTKPCAKSPIGLTWLMRWMIVFAALAGGIPAAVGQTTYLAQDATLFGASLNSSNPNYIGIGYANYNNANGDYVEFSVIANSAGTYPISFRYANGGTTDRPLQLSVNGVVLVGSLSFPVTGGWGNWAFTATNNAMFNAGLNKVRISSTGTKGGAVNYLLVTTPGTTNVVVDLASLTNTLSVPLRRPISPSQPMWLIHVDSWNYSDPQKIIDLIPRDIRPYVVMNISLSISHNSTNSQWTQLASAYETANSWLRTCAENGMWAMIQQSSGGYQHFSEYDLSQYEDFYRNFPNFIGFNYAEQFWGFGDPTDALSPPWNVRIAHFVDLMKLNQKYGGYLVVSWCGSYYAAGINPIAMMKKNPAFAAICAHSPQNFILEEKYTSSYGFFDIESTCLGAYLSGYCGQYGIRYDNTGWVGYTTNDAFHPAAASAPIIEHGMLTGETVMDGPEIIWQQDIQGLSNGTTPDGYTTRQWGFFPQFPNVSMDIFRKVLDGTIRIPGRQEVINRTKVVIINDVNSGSDQSINNSPQMLFTNLYLMYGDGTNPPDGTWLNQKDYFKKTGRYPAIPTVYALADSNANSFQVQVSNSLYSTRWPTIADKTNEFNSLFPQEYTGDIYAGRQENGWVIYNPYKSGQTASGSISFKYNTCDHVALTLSQYTAGVMKEFSNSLSIYLNNYDGSGASARTNLIAIYGSSSQPTYSYQDRGSHAASTVTPGWSGGVYTLSVTHNGAIDITVNCSGTGTGRLTSSTPATIAPPRNPLAYTGPHQYEAENFDYKNINGNVTSGIGNAVSNYNAQGFLKFGTSSTASIRDTNTVLESGTYRLETRYSVTGANVSTIDLYVNGIKVATPLFTQTPTLSSWATNKQYITLNAGANTIEFRANATAAGSVYFDDIVIVPTLYDTGNVIQENSAGFTSVDGTIDNTYPGYTGDGYANTTNASGAGIDWNINFDSSVTKAFTFRYAGTNDAMANLFINGTNVASNILFPSTGAWTNWDFVTVYAYTATGASDVRLQSTNSAGLPHIDYIEVTGGAAGTPANTPPTLAAISNQTVGVGVTLNITNSATDSDVPAQILTFSLLTAPANALINATSGVLTWRPWVTQANTTNSFTVRVADNGTPSMSATQRFVATVGPLVQPQIPTVSLSGDQLVLQVNGTNGPDYQIQSSTNLVNWSAIYTNNSPSLPFVWTNNITNGPPMNFFRVLIGPPFP